MKYRSPAHAVLATAGLLALVATLTSACSEPNLGRGPQADPDTAAEAHGAASADPADPSMPDARMLDGTIDRRIVIYVEASASELEALRDRYPEEEFGIIADDLMFYRSTAIEYLEGQRYPLLRIEGSRPLRFQVSGSPRQVDFEDVELLDFVVAYDPDREPRVIAPNEVHSTVEYFD